MPTTPFRRRLYLLTSTSLVACVLIVTPFKVEVRPEQSALNQTAISLPHGNSSFSGIFNLTLSEELHFNAANDRQAALAQLGLDESVGYTLPVVVTLSSANASGGDGGGGDGGGGDGGGGSGGGGSGGGGSGGGGSGGGGSGGGGSGGGGSGGGGSGGGSGASGASGASGSEASGSSDAGGTSGAFGGVEQVGNDLSADQESEAIGNGWQ